jgi:hypothetical protein
MGKVQFLIHCSKRRNDDSEKHDDKKQVCGPCHERRLLLHVFALEIERKGKGNGKQDYKRINKHVIDVYRNGLTPVHYRHYSVVQQERCYQDYHKQF